MIKNLPDKDGPYIEGCYNNKIEAIKLSANGWEITTIHSPATTSGAHKIADLICEARDIGYRQCQRDIRESLGLSS